MGNERETVHNDDCKQCIHHWLIDERNFGVCKKCGAGKQFSCSWSATSIQKAWGNKSNRVQYSVPGTES